MFIEVDTDYSEERCDLCHDHPLAPEKIKLTKEMFSDY